MGGGGWFARVGIMVWNFRVAGIRDSVMLGVVWG